MSWSQDIFIRFLLFVALALCRSKNRFEQQLERLEQQLEQQLERLERLEQQQLQRLERLEQQLEHQAH